MALILCVAKTNPHHAPVVEVVYQCVVQELLGRRVFDDDKMARRVKLARFLRSVELAFCRNMEGVAAAAEDTQMVVAGDAGGAVVNGVVGG